MSPVTTSVSKKARKRPRTEKRAQQNRAAQRRYREKLKLRQAQLESFAASRGFEPSITDSSHDAGSSPSYIQPDVGATLSLEPIIEDSGDGDDGDGGNDNDATYAGGDFSTMDIGDFHVDEPSEQDLIATVDRSGFYPEFMSRRPADLVSLLQDDIPAGFALDRAKILAEYERIALENTKRPLTLNSRLMLEHVFYVLGMNEKDSTSDLVKLAFQMGLNLRQLLLQGARNLVTQRVPIEPQQSAYYTGIANPYTNSLRFKRFATLDAFLSNALALGFNIPDLYKATFRSPFFRPEIKSVGDIKGSWAHYIRGLPPHLRPTSLQILRRHKPYLDLLPIPFLRMRIIMAVTAEDSTIDEYELKADIIHDGIVCTGAMNGTCRPWDASSWEISPWFRRKWASVLFDPLPEGGISV